MSARKMPEFTLSQQMTMTPQDYFDMGFLAGARAMQEAASLEVYERLEPSQADWASGAIRALDPEKVGG